MMQAVFAGGCFWSMEHVFDEIPGVKSVTAGYTGGSAQKPSYEQVELGITGHMVGLLGALISPSGCRSAPESSPVTELSGAPGLARMDPLQTLGIR